MIASAVAEVRDVPHTVSDLVTALEQLAHSIEGSIEAARQHVRGYTVEPVQLVRDASEPRSGLIPRMELLAGRFDQAASELASLVLDLVAPS